MLQQRTTLDHGTCDCNSSLESTSMLLGFHDPLDMVVVQSLTLVNGCDGMTLITLTDKSNGSSWNAISLLTDLLGSSSLVC